HGLFHSIQSNCTNCHSTSQFDASISKAHTAAGIGCIGCHGEHRGEEFKPGVVDSVSCVACHNDTYIYNGKVVGIPHGGTVGYPVLNGKWNWPGVMTATWTRKKLPYTPADYSPLEQFHLVHLGGRKEGRLNCKDCHETANFSDAKFKSSPRDSCSRCHAARITTASGPECVSCHQQHGRNKNQIVTLRKDVTGPIQKANFSNIP